MKIPITSIHVAERQRKELGNIEELMTSMSGPVGQVQAILVEEVRDTNFQYRLIAGRRRLEAAKRLGWHDIEATTKQYSSEEVRQEAEFEEDIRRKDRTWQEKCLALAKLHALRSVQNARDGYFWTIEKMAATSGFGTTKVGYMLQLADLLRQEPKLELWQCDGIDSAIKWAFQQQERAALAELERRRQNAPVQKQISTTMLQIARKRQEESLTPSEAKPTVITLQDRANFHNKAFPGNLPLVVNFSDGRPFLYGYWFIGGGNVSEYYGSYQTGYLTRIETLFPDKLSVVHLFSGSLPPSDKYVRVGIDPTGQFKADLEIDAHQLSSHLPFKPDLIYADPPYSVEDSEHYQNSMVNRPKIVSECATVLQPGGFLVWMDQALPVFSNDELRLVGCISYIRSTGNRFRCICIFQKPITIQEKGQLLPHIE